MVAPVEGLRGGRAGNRPGAAASGNPLGLAAGASRKACDGPRLSPTIVREQGRRARDSLAARLRTAPWEQYWTFTFVPRRQRIHGNPGVLHVRLQEMRQLPFAERVFARFFCDLNAAVYGQRRSQRDSDSRATMFVPWEFTKLGAVHCHPLALGVKDVRFNTVRRLWGRTTQSFGVGPGRSWIKPYQRGNLENYLAKYVTKDMTGDGWGVWGPWHLLGPKDGYLTASTEEQGRQLQTRLADDAGACCSDEANVEQGSS